MSWLPCPILLAVESGIGGACRHYPEQCTELSDVASRHARKCSSDMERRPRWRVSPASVFKSGEKHMLAKYMTASLAASALFATVAFAQTPSATTNSQTPPAANKASTPAAASTSNASYQGDWRASKVVGLNVYNNNNESIGSINDLLMDKSGNIKGVVIGVGGFLGVGEHLVAVAFDQIKFVTEPVASTTSSNTSSKSTTTTGASNNNMAPTSKSSAKTKPWYPDHAVFNATKDQLKAMPEFKYST
jgi:sporulation protein YlmC with PRC-barrel domain